MNQNRHTDQPVPRLFAGMTADERKRAEDALRRYFALVLRAADEKLGLTAEERPSTLDSSV